MRRIRVTRRAAADLKAIARHTRAEWGDAVMTAYLRDIDERIRRLAAMPDLGRARPDVYPDCRILPSGRHLIVYRAEGETIDILAVPHQAMDLPRHLSRR